MMKAVLFTSVEMLVFFCSCVRSAPSRPQYIGGRDAVAGEFPATVALAMYFDSVSRTAGDLRTFCTGVKIGPHEFATAAHCVVDTNVATKGLTLIRQDLFPPVEGTRNLAITNNPQAIFRDQDLVTVESVFIHPSVPESVKASDRFILEYLAFGGINDAADIAVIKVKESTDAIAVAPIESMPLSTGQEVVAGGYGLQSSARRSPTDGNLNLKVDTHAITGVKTNYLEMGFTSVSGAASQLSFGDSGGPLYKRDELGSPKLVGINSHGGDGKPDSCTRLDRSAPLHVYEWLDSILKGELPVQKLVSKRFSCKISTKFLFKTVNGNPQPGDSGPTVFVRNIFASYAPSATFSKVLLPLSVGSEAEVASDSTTVASEKIVLNLPLAGSYRFAFSNVSRKEQLQEPTSSKAFWVFDLKSENDADAISIQYLANKRMSDGKYEPDLEKTFMGTAKIGDACLFD